MNDVTKLKLPLLMLKLLSFLTGDVLLFPEKLKWDEESEISDECNGEEYYDCRDDALAVKLVIILKHNTSNSYIYFNWCF